MATSWPDPVSSWCGVGLGAAELVERACCVEMVWGVLGTGRGAGGANGNMTAI